MKPSSKKSRGGWKVLLPVFALCFISSTAAVIITAAQIEMQADFAEMNHIHALQKQIDSLVKKNEELSKEVHTKLETEHFQHWLHEDFANLDDKVCSVTSKLDSKVDKGVYEQAIESLSDKLRELISSHQVEVLRLGVLWDWASSISKWGSNLVSWENKNKGQQCCCCFFSRKEEK